MPDGSVDSARFYQHHLQAVSRSFAPCIAQLSEPLRSWVGLAYLLCRVIDTIEDAPWPDARQQQRHFEAVHTFIEQPCAPSLVDAWARGLPDAIVAEEQALMLAASRLFADLHTLPQQVRRPMQDTLRRMARGMCHYTAQRDGGGAIRLAALPDVNRYCFVVAGIVGQLLTELLALAPGNFVPSAQMALDGLHFGLFLQKVNLLKDQAKDELEGRFWLPDRQQVLAGLAVNARGAGRYLLAIPATMPSFRTFCGWSLFLGAHSLALYDGKQMEAKLERIETQALFTQLQQLVTDDVALGEALQATLAKLGPTLAAGKEPATPGQGSDATPVTDGAQARQHFAAWLQILGPTPLSFDDATQLGMA